MDFFHEYALLIAIALPVVVIVLIDLALALTGERGTLLLPSLGPFPSVPMPEIDEVPQQAQALEVEVVAHVEEERLAA